MIQLDKSCLTELCEQTVYQAFKGSCVSSLFAKREQMLLFGAYKKTSMYVLQI